MVLTLHDMFTETKANSEEGLVPYRNIFREVKKKQKIKMLIYFYKVIPSVQNSPTFPSTYSTSSASAIPETVRPIPSLPPSPQPTQCEDNKDKDFYDDPLSLDNSNHHATQFMKVSVVYVYQHLHAKV